MLCGVLYAFFNHTRIGVAMQATSQNQLAAYYMGIPVKMIFSLIWAISAGVAAAAGILLAPVTLIDINMGLAVALKAFAAAVLGGFGSIPGALIGGIVIGLIELYAGATLPDGFKDTAPYIVLLIMLIVRPQGLFGTHRRARRCRRAMRFQFKTSYHQDIRIFRDKVDIFWYGLLAVVVLILPLLMDDYYVGETAWVFIYGICGVSLMVLVGYTGLVSLGHAAFLGIGAYAHAYFIQHGHALDPVDGPRRWRSPRPVGLIVGLPALRMTGIYLTIATLAFAVIIQEVFSRWESVTQRLRRHEGRQAGDLRLRVRHRPVVLLSLPVLPGARAVGARATCCARPPAAPGSPSATARSRRSRWASTWRSTSRSPSPTRPG